jgi:hypothetical protein
MFANPPRGARGVAKVAPPLLNPPITQNYTTTQNGTIVNKPAGASKLTVHALGPGGIGFGTGTTTGGGGGGGGAYAGITRYDMTDYASVTLYMSQNAGTNTDVRRTSGNVLICRARCGNGATSLVRATGGPAAECVGDVVWKGGDGANGFTNWGGGGGGAANSGGEGGNSSGAGGGTAATGVLPAGNGGGGRQTGSSGLAGSNYGGASGGTAGTTAASTNVGDGYIRLIWE